MMDRQRARRDAWRSKAFRRLVEMVSARLASSGLPHALIGGMAVAYHANPPVTVDIDFLALADGLDELAGFVQEMQDDGWTEQRLWFSHRARGMPRDGLSFHKARMRYSVDVMLTGADEYLENVVRRASSLARPPVATAEDIVIMKSLVGRDKDMADVVALQRGPKKLDMGYVEERLEELL